MVQLPTGELAEEGGKGNVRLVPWYAVHAVQVYVRTYVRRTYVPFWYVRTYENVMSQLSDEKGTHVHRKPRVFGRIHGSQLRQGANAGQHTPTLSLPPSHHCLKGEVYRGNRQYNVCEHVGLDTNQSLHHPPERDVRTYVRMDIQ